MFADICREGIKNTAVGLWRSEVPQLPSLDGAFEKYASFIVRNRRSVLAVWVVVAVLMVPFALDSTSIVSYSINIPTSNNQSQLAENMVSTLFPGYQQPDNTYYVVLGGDVSSPQFYQKYLQLNQSLFSTLSAYGLKNVTSVYSLEHNLLDQMARQVPSVLSNATALLKGTAQGLRQVGLNLSSANSAVYKIFDSASNAATNVENLSKQLNDSNHATYGLFDAVNQTAGLIFGVPLGYTSVWSSVYSSPGGSGMTTAQINSAANQTYLLSTKEFGGEAAAVAYYSEFYGNWATATQGQTPSAVVSNLASIASDSINKTVPQYIASQGLNQSQAQLFTAVQGSLNLGDFRNTSALDSLTLALATSGLTPQEASIVDQSFSLGRNPSWNQVVNLALSIVTSGLSPQQAEFVMGAFNASTYQDLGRFSVQYFVNTTLDQYPSLGTTLSHDYNITLQQFATYAYNIGSSPQNETLLHEYQVNIVSDALSSNSTVSSLIVNDFNESVTDFVNQALQVSGSTNGSALEGYAVNLTTTAVGEGIGKVFYLSYNPNAIHQLVLGIQNGSVLPSSAAGEILSGGPGWPHGLAELPVSPGPGLMDQFVSPSRNTTVMVLEFKSPISAEAISLFESVVNSANSPGFATHYTSSTILDNDVQSVISDSERVALPFGIAVAVIVTGLFFLSPVAALLPMLMFGVALEVGFGLVDLVLGKLQGQTLSYISPIIIAVLGLGLASDYAVLMLNRFRQELRGDSREAGRTTTRWAGEAVFTSGLTVIMSYLALSLSGIPLFSDVGTANVLVVSVILACSLSLLPAVMSSSGTRLFWPSRFVSVKPSRLARITRSSMSRPKTVVGVLVVITLASAVLALTLPVNVNFLSLAPNTPGKQGLDQLTNSFGGSSLLPEYVVVQLAHPISSGNDTFYQPSLDFLSQVEGVIWSQPGVSSVYGPVSPYNSTIPVSTLNALSADQRSIYAQSMSSFVSKDNSTVYFKVVFKGDPFSNVVLSQATSLGNALSKIESSGNTVLLGGISTDSAGVLDYVFRILPQIILVLVAAIFVVLLLQLRSVFTPLRLIATILSSVAWTLGIVWILFYGVSGMSIYIFAPLFLVTTMLGVGMDYDIFLITRVREEVSKGRSDDDAIVRTAETTAGVITVLGLILGSVFFGLVLTQVKLLQQIGLTLTLGVLMDTFVVWLMFVPAIMVLVKKWNWWPGNPRGRHKDEVAKVGPE